MTCCQPLWIIDRLLLFGRFLGLGWVWKAVLKWLIFLGTLLTSKNEPGIKVIHAVNHFGKLYHHFYQLILGLYWVLKAVLKWLTFLEPLLVFGNEPGMKALHPVNHFRILYHFYSADFRAISSPKSSPTMIDIFRNAFNFQEWTLDKIWYMNWDE